MDHGFYYDDEDLPIVVTPVVEVGREWRFVVAGGRVVARCEYAAVGRVAGVPVGPGESAWAYAQGLVPRLSPESVFVLDVFETPAGLRLLEINPFSGADLYACDRAAIVAAVETVIAPRRS